MILSFTKRFFSARDDQGKGCTLIDKIAAKLSALDTPAENKTV